MAWHKQKLQEDPQYVLIIGANFVLGLVSFFVGSAAGIYFGFGFFIGVWGLYLLLAALGRKGAEQVAKIGKR